MSSKRSAASTVSSSPIDSHAAAGKRCQGLVVLLNAGIKGTGCPVGICGLAKRDYLDDVDIGYALLPRYSGSGYAYEAAAAVLAYAKNTLNLKRVVATTRQDNHGSAKLLEKLGLRFERMINHPDGDRKLRLFAIDIKQVAISRTEFSE